MRFSKPSFSFGGNLMSRGSHEMVEPSNDRLVAVFRDLNEVIAAVERLRANQERCSRERAPSNRPMVSAWHTRSHEGSKKVLTE